MKKKKRKPEYCTTIIIILRRIRFEIDRRRESDIICINRNFSAFEIRMRGENRVSRRRIATVANFVFEIFVNRIRMRETRWPFSLFLRARRCACERVLAALVQPVYKLRRPYHALINRRRRPIVRRKIRKSKTTTTMRQHL